MKVEEIRPCAHGSKRLAAAPRAALPATSLSPGQSAVSGGAAFIISPAKLLLHTSLKISTEGETE
jgi:hypothetical protein